MAAALDPNYIPVVPVYDPVTGSFLGTAPADCADPIAYLRLAKIRGQVNRPDNPVVVLDEAAALRRAEENKRLVEQARKALEEPWWKAQIASAAIAERIEERVHLGITDEVRFRESRYFEGEGKRFGKP